MGVSIVSRPWFVLRRLFRRDFGAVAIRPERRNLLDRGYFAEEALDIAHAGDMVGRDIGGAAVIHRDHIVIAHKGFTRGGFNADIGHDAGEHHCADAIAAQDQVEVGVVEGVVAMFGNDDVSRLWSNVAVEVALPRSGIRVYPPSRLRAACSSHTSER